MKTNDVKENAKQIWQLILSKRSVPIDEISKQMGKTNDVVMLAIGWLMQENKIKLNEDDEIIEINISISEIYY